MPGRAMRDRIAITDEIVVGTNTPDRNDLAELAEDGFRAVVDLRAERDVVGRAPPEREAEEAARLGLEHRRIPVSTELVDDGVLHRFRRAMIELPKPVFVHCGPDERRAGTLALLHVAIDEGASGDQMLARAERLGLSYGSAQLRAAMRRYVDAHRVGMPAAIRTPAAASRPARGARPRPGLRLPATTRRVERNTAEKVNRRIALETEQRVAWFAAHPEAIDRRLEELDREWDIERTLEANAASLGLVGVALGALIDRRFLLLPAAVAAFLLQHALQGWCPPVPFFRRRGVRTAAEIAAERTALKALRGDFDDLARPAPPAARSRTALDAAWA